MKAVTNTRYGSPEVLTLTEIAKPTPASNEVLVKVHAVTLNFADGVLLDVHGGKGFFIRLSGNGMFRPKTTILGSDFAGTVEAVGSDVTTFKPGDAVFGDSSAHGRRALAEYIAAPQDVLAHKPPNVSFEDASTIGISGVTALQGLRDVGHIQPGDQVVIVGASGGVGSFALQIAKAYGAEVTAVVSTSKIEMARTLGADHVIDYTREDFTRSGQRYDLILAANGDHTPRHYRRSLKPQGRYVTAGGSLRQIFGTMLFGSRLSQAGGQTFSFVDHHTDADDLATVGDLLAAGMVRPVIDACYPLEATAEAFRLLLDGHVAGKVVVTLG